MKKEMTLLIDNQNSLYNFTNSLLKYFQAETFHPSIKEVDELLKKTNKKRIACFLFDGMGEYILNCHKRITKYILKHKYITIQSTNPPTTVAATTAFLTGKSPIETGYLGWTQYLDDDGPLIDVFPGKNAFTGEKIDHPSITEKTTKTNIDELLKKAGVEASTQFSYPVDKVNGAKSIEEVFLKADDYFKDPKHQFLYSYHVSPDNLIHGSGVKGKDVHKVLKEVVKYLKKFVKKHPDILVFSFADHGLIDVLYRDIVKIPGLVDCLEKPFAIEGRAASFFVKKGKEQEFEESFRHYFPYFVLLKMDEALKMNFFGDGEMNPIDRFSFGNYLAISKKDEVLFDSRYKKEDDILFAHHAGNTEREKDICLSVYNN